MQIFKIVIYLDQDLNKDHTLWLVDALESYLLFFLASDSIYYQHSDHVPKVVGSRKVNKPQFSFLNSLDK